MRYSFFYLLALAFLPIQNIGADVGLMTLKLSQLFFLLYIGFVIVSKRTCIPKPRSEFILLYFAFMGLLASTIFSNDPERSVVLSFAYALCIVFLLSTLIYLRTVENALLKIKYVLYASSTIYSIYGILQLLLFFWGYDANVNFEAWDLVPRVPYFSAENVHAAFLIAVIPFAYVDFFSNSKKVKSFILFLILFLNIGGLVATGSRGAIIALLVACATQTFIYSIFMGKVKSFLKVGILAGFCALLSVVYFDELFLRFNSLLDGDDGTASVRFNHYKQIFQYFISRPIFGIGLGSSWPISGHDVHNVFLQILFEGGLVSFLPFFVAILLSTYYCYRIVTNSRSGIEDSLGIVGVFIAIFIQALMEPSLYFYHLYFVLALVMHASSLPRFSKQ